MVKTLPGPVSPEPEKQIQWVSIALSSIRKKVNRTGNAQTTADSLFARCALCWPVTNIHILTTLESQLKNKNKHDLEIMAQEKHQYIMGFLGRGSLPVSQG